MSPGTMLILGATAGFAIGYSPAIPHCVDLMTDTKFVVSGERLVHTLVFLVWCACVCSTCVCLIVLSIVYLLSGEVPK